MNLGARNRVAMADLREMAAGLGHLDVTTHLASGNLLFTDARAQPEAALGAELESAIERRFGVRTRIALRRPAELAELVRALDAHVAGLDPARVAVVFLLAPPAGSAPDAVAALAAELAHFRFAAQGRQVVLHADDWLRAMGAAQAAVERALGPGTVRNWNTVRKLAAMAAD